MSASITISYHTSNQKKGQKAIPNVSESATNAELYNFAYDLIQLSTLTFDGVKKIVTTEITAPTGGN